MDRAGSAQYHLPECWMPEARPPDQDYQVLYNPHIDRHDVLYEGRPVQPYQGLQRPALHPDEVVRYNHKRPDPPPPDASYAWAMSPVRRRLFGTLDKLEAIPGYKVKLSKEEFHRDINECGFVSALSQPIQPPHLIRQRRATTDHNGTNGNERTKR